MKEKNKLLSCQFLAIETSIAILQNQKGEKILNIIYEWRKKDWKQIHYNIVKETLDISSRAKELLISIEPVEHVCGDDWGYRKGYYSEEEKLIKEVKKCLEKMATATAKLQVLKDVYDNN